MNILENNAEILVQSYINTLKGVGFLTSSPEKKQYNYELIINDKLNNSVKLLIYFGKKGIKTVLQGNTETKLYSEVNNIIFGDTLFTKEKAEADYLANRIVEPEEYIGSDESGKGDYFGPLVICGVYVNKDTSYELKKTGVKDSKELSDGAIKEIALSIKKIIDNKFSLIAIAPAKYNLMHEKMGNVNRILGWGHAKVLENLLEYCKAKEAVSDKFGDEKYIINSLQDNGKIITLHQFTKAESYTAVAAASILARDKFCSWFEVQRKVLGMELPKGAASIVEDTALRIKDNFGCEKLNELVKLHFKTTRKII